VRPPDAFREASKACWWLVARAAEGSSTARTSGRLGARIVKWVARTGVGWSVGAVRSYLMRPQGKHREL